MPGKVLLQSFERMVKPPAAGPAHLVVARRFVIQNINRNHRPLLRSCRKGGLVCQTQIAPQPDYLWFGQSISPRVQGFSASAADRFLTEFIGHYHTELPVAHRIIPGIRQLV